MAVKDKMAVSGKARTAEEVRRDTELSTAQILRALIDEAVRSRVRHRALLEVLVDSKLIALRDYVESYQKEESKNFVVLLDMLLMQPSDFRTVHEKWLEEQRQQLGYQSDLYHNIELNRIDKPETLPGLSLGSGQKSRKSKKRKPARKQS